MEPTTNRFELILRWLMTFFLILVTIFFGLAVSLNFLDFIKYLEQIKNIFSNNLLLLNILIYLSFLISFIFLALFTVSFLRRKRKIAIRNVAIVSFCLSVILVLISNPSKFLVIPSPEFLEKSKSVLETAINQPTPTIKSEVKETGNILFKKTEDEKKEIEEIRQGPDGTSVHFKFLNQDLSQKNGDMVLSNCGMYGEPNGYLWQSDNFAFIEIDDSDQASVVIEDLKSKEISEIPLTTELTEGLMEKIEHKNGQVINQKMFSVYKNKYEAHESLGKNDKTYFYPGCDTKVSDDKLIIYFGQLALALDKTKKEILGNLALIEPEYSYQELAFNFRVYSSEKLPSINIIEGLWEGDEKFQALLDLSGDKLKVVNLTNYNERLYNLLKTNRVVWKEDSVIINFFKTEDLTDSLIEQKFGKNHGYFSSIENDYEKRKAEQESIASQLKISGNYEEVVCDFQGGMYSGCQVMISFDSYRYTPGGDLKKL